MVENLDAPRKIKETNFKRKIKSAKEIRTAFYKDELKKDRVRPQKRKRSLKSKRDEPAKER